MQTVAYYRNLDNIEEKINYLTGTKDELKDICDFVDYTAYDQEIFEWFEIFLFNLRSLKGLGALESKDDIAINSHVMTLLSAGKNIEDLIKLCIDDVFGKDSTEANDFTQNIFNKEYDSCYNYRLLLQMRNYSQHGHIPVSFHEGVARFDLANITRARHFKINKTVHEETLSKKEEIEKKRPEDAVSPGLDVPYTISSYAYSLYRVYSSFLNVMKQKISANWKAVQEIIKENPDLINHQNEKFNGYLFYIIEDEDPDNLQTFNVLDDPIGMLAKQNNALNEAMKEEKQELKEFKKRSVPI